ncbi:MAG: OadG family protein [Lachnospiraceae bacterium]|nr:OadG family protein [Lachnospiraceae bacterium]
MKKITIFAAAALCAFGLTACGSAEEYSDYQMQKIQAAETNVSAVIRTLEFCSNGTIEAVYGINIPWDEYTMDEVAATAQTLMGGEVDGYGFYNGYTSFKAAQDTLGSITFVDSENIETVANDEQIIVSVPVTCENGDATVEVIFSNDQFLKLESASITQNFTMGEKMEKGALNTLIGISTVFIVLILISLLISCFGVIPKIQKAIADGKKAKEEEKSVTEKSIDNAVNQIIANETVDESDDLELVAVIAAAIAAYEGSATTEGYVVRSIRRRR